MQYSKPALLFLVLILLFTASSFCQSEDGLSLEFVWEDEFSIEETKQIKTWLVGVSGAIAQTLGIYPFTVKLYIHRTSGKEPVPWAETSRSGEQAIHFHVDPSYPLEDFQKDWTAAHELSHISIPFVGRSNMWFSEGYASYWQWQILHQQGIYSIKEIQEKYQAKLDKIKPSFNTNESFIETSKKLKANHNYPALYWGGACYFFQADSLLKKEYDTSLEDVIQRYQTDRRMTDKNLDDLINSLDLISNSQVFSELLNDFQNETARAVVYPTVLSFSE